MNRLIQEHKLLSTIKKDESNIMSKHIPMITEAGTGCMAALDAEKYLDKLVTSE